MAPIAIGVALMSMVYMGGHISGAHYNPAVSLGLYMIGKMKPAEMFKYWVSQIAGAIAASLVFYIMFNVTMHGPAPAQGYSIIQPLLLEILFTFALALVVLNVAVSKKTSINSFYGLAIGFTVMAGAFAAGPVSGGAFNPAVGIGPNLIDMACGNGSLSNVWIYIVGPLVGAAIAALVFKFTHSPEEY